MTHRERTAKVYHADLWGRREEKYAWLQAHDWKTTEWRAVQPAPDLHVLRPMDAERHDRYSRFWSVADIFSENGRPAPGIVTTHDDFAISWTREEVARKVQALLQTRSEEEARMLFKLCSQSQWSYERAKQELADGSWRELIVPILYRPFDLRWTVNDRNVAVHRRERVMHHMLAGENLALITARSNKSPSMDHFFCSTYVVETKCGESTVQSYTLPLYLYPHPDQRDFLAPNALLERRPNLNPELVATLAEAYGREPSPEEIFQYVYAVLYAPTYREKYAEFLRLDFPRIPFTSNPELFRKMAELGGRLVALHLLRSPELDPPLARFQGEGDGKVLVSGKKGLRYDAERERVYINPTQYFAPVPPKVWEYQIGGYQVCHKWLKDRKDRTLTLDEIRTYCRITTALSKTIDIQREIDPLYPNVEEGSFARWRARQGHVGHRRPIDMRRTGG